MAVAGLTITGVDSLIRRMSVLPVNIENKVMKGATTKAIRPVVNAARRLARKDKRTGLLAKSIGQKTKQYKSTQTTIAIAGPRKGFKDPRTGENPTQIAHLIEGGVKPHEITTPGGGLSNTRDVAFGFQQEEIFFGKKVSHPGSNARPFLEPAFNENKTEMERTFAQELEKGVHTEAAKLGVIL